MATYERGVLGSFNGKVGTVVGAKWKGIEYMKIKRGKSTKPPTERQLVQQAKFSLLIKFIATMSRLFLTTFKDSAVRMTGTNSAFKYNFEHALAGAYPSFSLDYTQVAISKGQLHNAGAPVASASGSGKVRFDWADNSGAALANADDNCIMVVYCPELRSTAYTQRGATRDAKTDIMDVAHFTGKTVETWLGFISADGAEVATSVYTGQVVVS